jgi:hypothetical protein
MRSAYGDVRLMTSPTRKCDPLILLHLRISCMKCTITRIFTVASAGRDDAARVLSPASGAHSCTGGQPPACWRGLRESQSQEIPASSASARSSYDRAPTFRWTRPRPYWSEHAGHAIAKANREKTSDAVRAAKALNQRILHGNWIGP